MNVAAHGEVDTYCAEHGMVIVERYTGPVAEYEGNCIVLVTDNCEDQNEYYYLKLKLWKRGIELISTHWYSSDVNDFVWYMSNREKALRKQKYRGRIPFGFRFVDGEMVADEDAMRVAQRIISLRDAGAKFKEIVEDPEVAYPDGRRMSISTVQVILKNRGKYDGN